MVNPTNNIAASAYEAANRLKGVMGPGAGAATEDTPSFADLISSGLEGAVDSQKKAEQLSKDAVLGKADINEVILAVQDADVMLSTVVAIRDRIVSAYQDILRMSV